MSSPIEIARLRTQGLWLGVDEQDILARALLDLTEKAEGVTWFDWSGNDEDAVRAVDDLGAVLARIKGEK